MHVNVSEYLRDAAGRRPDGDALVHGARTTTWSRLDADVDAVARGLTARGLVAGQRVALAMTNRPELVIAYLAAVRVGLVAVPLPPREDAGRLREALSDCGASLVVCDDVAARAVRDAVGRDRVLERECAVVVTGTRARRGETAWDALSVADGPDLVAPRDAETLAVLLYTGGSTGRPRAAMLPHRALVAGIEQVAALEPPLLTTDDTCLVVLPLFHVYALNALLGQAMRQGSRLVLVDADDPAAALTAVREHGVTVVPATPRLLTAWAGRADLREALASVRTLVSGAALLDPDVAEQVTRATGLAVESGYGLTEAAPVVATTVGQDAATVPGPGVVGRPVPGVQVRVVDVGGTPAGPDDPGEIHVRGDNLFLGYWPDASGGPDPDGWFATGDLGLLDVDGCLTLVDRVQEVVMVSGFTVYPVEVELVAAETPGVAQAAVVGVPDARTTEAVVLLVVPEPGTSRDGLVARVQAQCEQNLARFKQPAHVLVVDDLPVGPDGTVLKARLRARARREVPGTEAP